MTAPRLFATLRWLSALSAVSLVTAFFFASTQSATAIPALARKYGLACADCHTHGGKLNTFGLEFVAKGPKALDLEEKSPLTPITLYASWLARKRPSDNEITATPSRLELVAFEDVNDRLSYFVEWRLFSRDNGADDFVDRSGRFEDVYVTYHFNDFLGFQMGQFRSMAQYDVSQRISNSEPAAFAKSMPGPGSSSTRLTATRAFSLSGRSPAVRLMTNSRKLQGWHTAVTLPFGGELSLPLGQDASRNASSELEANPKGVFVEHYFQKDLDTFGINAFAGSENRSSIGLVGTKTYEALHFVGGLVRQRDRLGERTLFSLDTLYAPRWNDVYGLRLDLEQSQPAALVPYMSYHIGAPGSVFRIVLEGKFQNRRRPAVALEINFLY